MTSSGASAIRRVGGEAFLAVADRVLPDQFLGAVPTSSHRSVRAAALLSSACALLLATWLALSRAEAAGDAVAVAETTLERASQ